jgi:hypothetical protein
MRDNSYDIAYIEAKIASGQDLLACMKDLRSFERRVKELKSRIALQAAATTSTKTSAKRRVIQWPTTACMLQEEALTGDHFHHVNLLRFFDYRVGKSGLETPERQRILKYLYFGELPRVRSEGHMKRWGGRGTPQRLKMLVLSIVDSMEYTKGKSGSNDLTVALRDWRSDLKWLKKSYYAQLPKGSFKWPIV